MEKKDDVREVAIFIESIFDMKNGILNELYDSGDIDLMVFNQFIGDLGVLIKISSDLGTRLGLGADVENLFIILKNLETGITNNDKVLLIDTLEFELSAELEYLYGIFVGYLEQEN